MGQEIYDAERVIVLIETRSGRKIGWEVVPDRAPRWEMTSVGSDGTHARVSVEGWFFRKWIDHNIDGLPSREFVEIEPAIPELEE